MSYSLRPNTLGMYRAVHRRHRGTRHRTCANLDDRAAELQRGRGWGRGGPGRRPPSQPPTNSSTAIGRTTVSQSCTRMAEPTCTGEPRWRRVAMSSMSDSSAPEFPPYRKGDVHRRGELPGRRSMTRNGVEVVIRSPATERKSTPICGFSRCYGAAQGLGRWRRHRLRPARTARLPRAAQDSRHVWPASVPDTACSRRHSSTRPTFGCRRGARQVAGSVALLGDVGRVMRRILVDVARASTIRNAAEGPPGLRWMTR